MTKYLFVYGTLKRACSNYGAMNMFTRYVADAVTTAPYLMVCGAYHFPLLFDASHMDGNHRPAYIEGELHEITGSVVTALNTLDRFEGVPYLYKREIIAVKHGDSIVSAWVYFYARHSFIEIMVRGGSAVRVTDRFSE